MIFITGASAGIGAACARLFAKKGRELFLVARRGDRLAALQRELELMGAPKVLVQELDVSCPEAVQKFLVERASDLSRVRVLVNNAGLATGIDKIQDGDPDAWDVMWDTNVRGLLRVTRGILPHLLSAGEGHIVNLGSVAGRWIYPKGNIYCATKAAVRAITEALRLDLVGTGIRVTEIAPGMAETEFSLVRFKDVEKAREVYRGMSPLTAEDIAESIVWCTERPKHVDRKSVV